MAEGGQENQEQTSMFTSLFPRARNTVVMFLNRNFRTRFRQVRPRGQNINILPIFDELQREVNYGAIASMNDAMIQAERDWDGGYQGFEEINAGYLRDAVRQLYKDFGYFYDVNALDKEHRIAGATACETHKESINVNVLGLGQRMFDFTVPSEREIVFDHGLSYKVSYVGSGNSGYYKELETDIHNFCESIKRELLTKHADVKTRDAIEQKISVIKQLASSLKTELESYMREFDEKHRSFLNGLQTKLVGQVEPLREKVTTRRLTGDKVFYRHTFIVIKPYRFVKVRYTPRSISEDPTTGIPKITEGDANAGESEETLYFNPRINPLRDELEYTIREINNLNQTRTRAVYEDKIRQANLDLENISARIKNLISSALINQFGTNLASELDNEFEVIVKREKTEKIGEFLSQAGDYIIQLTDLLKSLRLKNYAIPQSDRFDIRGEGREFIGDLVDLLDALKSMDRATFRFHVPDRNRNDFASWINGVFNNTEFARKVFNARTQEAIINLIQEAVNIDQSQFERKINELFDFIYAKLNETGIVADAALRRQLDVIKSQLSPLPSDITDDVLNNVSANLRSLFDFLSNTTQNYIGGLDNGWNNLKNQVVQRLNELAGSEGEEFTRRRIVLFDSMVEILLRAASKGSASEIAAIKEQLKKEENEIGDDYVIRLKRFIANLEGVFNNLLNNTAISELRRKERHDRIKKYCASKIEEFLKLEIRRNQLTEILNSRDFVGTPPPHLVNFSIRDGEREDSESDWGLDKNGYSLEVADSNYTFNGVSIPEGTVLLDVFDTRIPEARRRRVPLEFTDFCDLLDMATWTYVQFDAYRDDLRDGRYHKNSLSVMENILRLNQTKTDYLEFGPSNFNLNQELYVAPHTTDFRTTDHMSTTMRLNRDNNNQPNRPQQVDIKITPTHLNPAFDLRARRLDLQIARKHIGRKLYYDLQENTAEDDNFNKSPMISTRGAALYILARVIEDVKYWDEAIALLDAIGEQTHGFDIGPNLQGREERASDGTIDVQFGRWGKALTYNPFKPITGARRATK